MRDLKSNIGAVQAIVPAVKSATANGSTIDLTGYESVAFVVNTGAIVSAGDFSVKVQESDTTTDGDFADADSAVVASEAPATLEADSTYRIGYTGFKQYVRLVITKASGTSIAAGAVAILGHPHKRPVA